MIVVQFKTVTRHNHLFHFDNTIVGCTIPIQFHDIIVRDDHALILNRDLYTYSIESSSIIAMHSFNKLYYLNSHYAIDIINGTPRKQYDTASHDIAIADDFAIIVSRDDTSINIKEL